MVLVGTGPQEAMLRERAPLNVTMLSSVTDPELRALYAKARALIAASFEDFGLAPVEAAAFGVPVIALRYGGYLDTVVEDTTGVFFDVAEPGPIARAVRACTDMVFDADKIQQHARQYDEDHFRARMCALGCENPAAESRS